MRDHCGLDDRMGGLWFFFEQEKNIVIKSKEVNKYICGGYVGVDNK